VDIAPVVVHAGVQTGGVFTVSCAGLTTVKCVPFMDTILLIAKMSKMMEYTEMQK